MIRYVSKPGHTSIDYPFSIFESSNGISFGIWHAPPDWHFLKENIRF